MKYKTQWVPEYHAVAVRPTMSYLELISKIVDHVVPDETNYKTSCELIDWETQAFQFSIWFESKMDLNADLLAKAILGHLNVFAFGTMLEDEISVRRESDEFIILVTASTPIP